MTTLRTASALIAIAFTAACADAAPVEKMEIAAPSAERQAPGDAAPQALNIPITVGANLGIQVDRCQLELGEDRFIQERPLCDQAEMPTLDCPTASKEQQAKNPALGELIERCETFAANGPEQYRMRRSWSPGMGEAAPMEITVQVIDGVVFQAHGPTGGVPQPLSAVDVFAEAAALLSIQSPNVEVAYQPDGAIAEIAIRVVGADTWSVASFDFEALDPDALSPREE